MKQTFKPILFNTEMVQAILAGTKTQTRRIIKPQPEKLPYFMEKWPYGKIGDILWVRETFEYYSVNWDMHEKEKRTSSVAFNYKATIGSPKEMKTTSLFAKKAVLTIENDKLKNSSWKPSIFMPKEACRIFLKITDIRVERLQEISEADAIKEGVHYEDFFESYDCYLCRSEKGHRGALHICEDGYFDNAFESFRSLWYSLNGENSWQQNPFVWVIQFERISKPEGFN